MSAMLPDLPPSPPEKPLAFDCCESGCDRCVFDIYAEELAFYEAELAAWRESNPGLDPDAARRQRDGHPCGAARGNPKSLTTRRRTHPADHNTHRQRAGE